MENKFFKNIEASNPMDFAGLVEYKPGQVISLTLVQNPHVSMTVFAFSKGEGISTHSAPGDAFVYMLDGAADITVGDKTSAVTKGQAILMPANIAHGLEATENFKMLLVVVF